MVYTPLGFAAAGQLVDAAWMNLYLRDNLNALNSGGGKVPPLAICWWGEGSSRPSNWFLCDGTVGTYDLRDRLIVGAGSTYAVGASGGAATVTPVAHSAHVIFAPDHNQHSVNAASAHGSSSISGTRVGSGHNYASDGSHSGATTSGSHAHTGHGLTDTHAHAPSARLPPYVARTPIVKGTPTLSYTTPRTWADGDVPNAAMFNADLRDNFNYLRQQMLQATSVLLWSGSLTSLPSGYQLCNGSNSTPDMRDRFMISAGSAYAVGDSGGAVTAAIAAHANHVATQADAHGNHGLSLASHSTAPANESGGVDSFYQFVDHSNVTISAGHSVHSGFSVNAHGAHVDYAALPPYIALGYIALMSSGSYTTPRTWADGELVDAARINTYLRDNEAVLYAGQVPIGGGFAWHNSIASIPATYVQLNGAGGTYDTRDRFVAGAGTTYAVGATGGATTSAVAGHADHTVNFASSHTNHSIVNSAHPNTGINEVGGGSMLVFSSFTHNFSIAAAGEHDHSNWLVVPHSGHVALNLLPPYTALAFIQRAS